MSEIILLFYIASIDPLHFLNKSLDIPIVYIFTLKLLKLFH